MHYCIIALLYYCIFPVVFCAIYVLIMWLLNRDSSLGSSVDRGQYVVAEGNNIERLKSHSQLVNTCQVSEHEYTVQEKYALKYRECRPWLFEGNFGFI